MIILDNVLFYFAGMPVYVYGFFTGLGLLFGAASALKADRRRGISWSNMFDFILGTAFAFFVAGRLAVLIGQYGAGALLTPWKILTELSAGVDLRVGLIFAVIYGLISTFYKGIFGLHFLDAITPGLIWIKLFSALGSNVLGRTTAVPWAVQLGEFKLHPLSLYTALGYYVIRFIVLQVRQAQRFDGQIFISALTLVVWLHWLLLFAAEESSRAAFWLYSLLGILLAALWSFGHANSPQIRKPKRSLGYWAVQLVLLVIVVVAICFYYYSRFQ